MGQEPSARAPETSDKAQSSTSLIALPPSSLDTHRQPPSIDTNQNDNAPSLVCMSSAILPPQHPDPSCPPASPPAPLTADQQTALAALVAHFASPELKIPVPTTTVPEGCTKIDWTESLTELEQFWLTEEKLLMFLRATKGDAQQARTRIETTLKWRREFGIDGFTPEYIS